jgi:hypothetical protein
VKTKLRTIAAAALPVVALALGAMSSGARADASTYVRINAEDEPMSTFVGQQAYDEKGVLLGVIHEVVVDNGSANAPATAIVTREDGETLALPLGPSDAIATLVNAREMLEIAEQISPVVIGQLFSPESRGS